MLDSRWGNRVAIFGALGVFWFCLQTQRHLLASLLGASSVTEDLGITAAGAGLLVGVYFPTYGFVQIPAGVLADVASPRRNLLIAAAGIIFSATLFGLAPNFEVALLARALVGVSSGLVYLSIIKLCVNWSTGRNFGIAIGVVNALGNFGAIVSFMVMPLVLVSLPWRTTALLAVALLLFMPLSMLVIRDRPEGCATPAPSRQAGRRWPSPRTLAKEIKPIVGRRDYWFFSILSLMWVGFHFAVINWIPRYCLDVLDMPKAMTGLLPALMTAGVAVANLLYGPYYARHRSRARPMLIFCNVSYILLLSAFILAGPAIAGNFAVLAVIAICLGMLIGNFPLVLAALRDIIPLPMVGTGIGIYNGLSFLCGFVFPWLVGGIMDVVDKPTATGAWVFSHNAYAIAFIGGCAILALTLMVTLVFTRERQPVVTQAS